MTRYSNLAELSIIEQFALLLSMADFFSPLQSNKYHALLDITVEPQKIKPLSLLDFINYHKKEKNIDLFKNHNNLLGIVDKMVSKHYLSEAGSKGWSGGLGKCYLFLKEFSAIQKEGNFWVTEILGFNYLIERTRSLVIQITGKNEIGDIHCGSGLLINSNIIITCAHVINDMKIDETQNIFGKKIKVIFSKAHEKIDVGVIKIDGQFELTKGLAFADNKLLDEILILGYPKIPFSRQSELISQKGEVNGSINDFKGNNYFMYSTFTRPGNSGGPIFNAIGNVVGIVSREIFNKDIEYNQVPFCLGVPSLEIVKAVNEIDNSIKLPIEDFS
jgi:S1-C subfamily serine protease